MKKITGRILARNMSRNSMRGCTVQEPEKYIYLLSEQYAVVLPVILRYNRYSSLLSYTSLGW